MPKTTSDIQDSFERNSRWQKSVQVIQCTVQDADFPLICTQEPVAKARLFHKGVDIFMAFLIHLSIFLHVFESSKRWCILIKGVLG